MRAALAFLSLASILWATDARADDGAPAPAPVAPSAPPEHPQTLPMDPSLPEGEKRPPQDYEGRPYRSSVGEDALWVPRVLLFPMRAVTDYVVRAPIGALAREIDRGGFVDRLKNVFTFGPHHSVGLIPTAFYEFGFRPSVGVYHFYDDFLATDNRLRAHFATGGEKYFTARLADRIPLWVGVDDAGAHEVRAQLQLEIDGLVRADYRFYGIGWDTRRANDSLFEERSVGGGARVRVEPRAGSFVESWALYRRHRFSDTECAQYPRDCTVRPISLAVFQGRYSLPPGFDGYQTFKVGGHGVFDSRRPRPEPGSGVVADARVELASDLTARSEWAQIGGTLGGYLDLTGTRRVLGLLVDARMIEPFEDDVVIPFSELIGAIRSDRAPDSDFFRGFAPGRLLGESSVVATLEYSWPIWSFLDATVQAQVGNVFGREFQDFEFERLRFAFVGGIRAPQDRDHAMNLLLGFGTRPFVEGGAPDGIRFLIGGTTGF